MDERVDKDKFKALENRPVLGRRATCQYYSPSMVLSNSDEKRLQVVLELFQTEEKYRNCLNSLKVDFEDKLKAKNIISIKDVEIIFPAALKEISHVHNRLYDDLKTRLQLWSYTSTVGDVFVDYFSRKNQFNLIGSYSSYSNNFPKAVRTINRCICQSIDFEIFLQSCSRGRPSWKGFDLHSLLLNPIQRLPRYLLLIKQLIRFTDVGHPDRVHLEQALLAMSQTITVLNNSIESSLQVASEYSSRKRIVRRRLPVNQKDVIKIISRSTDRKPDENSVAHSRPVSICSSISSGYASGDENEVATSSSRVCACDECNVSKESDIPRMPKELRHETALQQIAKQKFDFSGSVISPTLQKLLDLKRELTLEESKDKIVEKENLLAIEKDKNETPGGQRSSKCVTDDDIDNTMDNFIEDFTNTINNLENLHLMKMLSRDQKGSNHDLHNDPLSVKKYSVPLGLKRSRNATRSWTASSAPYSSGDNISHESLPVGVYSDEDDNVSIWSGVSTLSGDSCMSGLSTLSAPVIGKHATKRKYFKLKDFFKQLRGGKEKRSQSLISDSNTIRASFRDQGTKYRSSLQPPRMMVSSV